LTPVAEREQVSLISRGGGAMSKEELERLDDQGMSAWDSHDPDAWAAMFGEDFTLQDWTLPEPIRDREGVRQYLNGWVGAFPDMRMKQTNRVVGDDAVAAEVEFQGTNTGSMLMAGKEISADEQAGRRPRRLPGTSARRQDRRVS
jgi:SnoaL-like protein